MSIQQHRQNNGHSGHSQSNVSKILPDYFKTPHKNPIYLNLYLANLFSKAIEIKNPVLEEEGYSYDLNIDLSHIKEELIDLGMSFDVEKIVELFKEFASMMEYDASFRTHIIAIKRYNGKNYLVTKSLSDALKKTKMTLKGKHLKSGTSGYIEFRDKSFKFKDEDIIGTFYSIERIENEHALHCSMIARSGAILYFSIGADLEENIAEEFTKKGKDKYEEFLHVLTSTIVFIGNQCEDFVFERNVFSNKKSKYEAQIKQFTELDYVIVGKNFHQPKIYNVNESVVVGHFKWAWVGEGRSQLALRWWNEHTRRYNNEL